MPSDPLATIVIPTIHGTLFVPEILYWLNKEALDCIEVIVVDNSAEKTSELDVLADEFAGGRLKIIKTPTYLNMVDNWNHALAQANGEYVIYLTDKMIFLPGFLRRLIEILQSDRFDILNWTDDLWTPVEPDIIFGEGWYRQNNEARHSEIGYYDPQKEISRKTMCNPPRRLQSRSDYVRGKICFGAYSRSLINRIVKKYRKLFHHISPDYTSMILGLNEATLTAEVHRSGIVCLGTNLSTGNINDLSSTAAYGFLCESGKHEELIEGMPVKGLYCSTHNSILRDYLRMKNEFNFQYEISFDDWFVEIGIDLSKRGRLWPSDEEKKTQIALFEKCLTQMDKTRRDKIKRQICEHMIVLRDSLRDEFVKLVRPLIYKYTPYRNGVVHSSFREGVESLNSEKRIVLPQVE